MSFISSFLFERHSIRISIRISMDFDWFCGQGSFWGPLIGGKFHRSEFWVTDVTGGASANAVWDLWRSTRDVAR